MHIVTQKHLSDATKRYREAAKELGIWQTIVRYARWQNFTQVRETFTDADLVDGYVVFNIRRNRYRLITVIHYARDKPLRTQGHVYIRAFLTHGEYNDRSNWDPFSGIVS